MGGILCRHLFFANISKTAARSVAKVGLPAHQSRIHLVCKFCLPRSKGQVTRSGQSHMCTPGPASSLKIVLWAQFKYERFQTLRMKYWNGYLQNVCFGFFILVTSDQVIFRPGPLPKGNCSPLENMYFLISLNRILA